VAARPDHVMVIVTSEPEFLGFLGQDGARDPLVAAQIDTLRDNGSTLQRLLAQAAQGGSRNIPPVTRRRTVRFAVRHIEYELEPTPAPAAETARFLVDDRPAPSASTRRSRGDHPAIAVRLCELVVHDAEAFGPVDIRADTLVTTGADDSAWHATTSGLGGAHDERRLPPGGVLVYEGPVVDHVDMACWVSRDRAGSSPLDQMLAERLEPGTSGPGTRTAGVLVDTADQLLGAVGGLSVGLYRTSLLAVEDFGRGRHPVHGLIRAGDVSFAYRIDPVH
jgi:hypothetical protein